MRALLPFVAVALLLTAVSPALANQEGPDHRMPLHATLLVMYQDYQTLEVHCIGTLDIVFQETGNRYFPEGKGLGYVTTIDMEVTREDGCEPFHADMKRSQTWACSGSNSQFQCEGHGLSEYDDFDGSLAQVLSVGSPSGPSFSNPLGVHELGLYWEAWPRSSFDTPWHGIYMTTLASVKWPAPV